MKKITSILLISIFVFANTAFAQIPNSGFESWTTVGSYSNPTSWSTMNNTTATFSIFTANIGTPGSPGSSYLKLTSKTINGSLVNGIAVSGVLDSLNLKAKSGFAFNLKPQSFTGKWQHMIYGSSQGSVKAILTKWNIGLNKRDTIATAAQTLSGMAMSWSNFTIYFTYLSGAIPDSCIIELKASGSNPTNNDYLWVDNLALSGSVTCSFLYSDWTACSNNIQTRTYTSSPLGCSGNPPADSTSRSCFITGIQKQESFLSGFVVYPNPTNETLSMNFNLKTPQQITIELIDMTGNVIKEIKTGEITGKCRYELNISNISKGNYFLKVISNNLFEVKKIIID